MVVFPIHAIPKMAKCHGAYQMVLHFTADFTLPIKNGWFTDHFPWAGYNVCLATSWEMHIPESLEHGLQSSQQPRFWPKVCLSPPSCEALGELMTWPVSVNTVWHGGSYLTGLLCSFNEVMDVKCLLSTQKALYTNGSHPFIHSFTRYLIGTIRDIRNLKRFKDKWGTVLQPPKVPKLGQIVIIIQQDNNGSWFTLHHLGPWEKGSVYLISIRRTAQKSYSLIESTGT